MTARKRITAGMVAETIIRNDIREARLCVADTRCFRCRRVREDCVLVNIGSMRPRVSLCSLCVNEPRGHGE